MDTSSSFDYHGYIRSLVSKNRLMQSLGFVSCTCTGIGGLEEVLDCLQTKANIIATDDITPGQTVHNGGAWYNRRTFTLFIVMRYRFGDEDDRLSKLSTCRHIMRQIQSRLIHDSQQLMSELTYIDVNKMATTDLGASFLAGSTGMYLVFSVDEPTDLNYISDEWDE